MEFVFKKKYGQNFLTNQTIINKIVQSIEPTNKDLIIEIGPGAGALSKRLKQYGTHLICYEIDQETRLYLDELEDEHTHIIYDDFLKRDIMSDIRAYDCNRIFVIGNLPYYITTPIISKIITDKIPIYEAVFMVQKEVAERFVAKPNHREYGAITVFLNAYFHVSKLFDVSKNYFIPKPKVESAVVKFTAKTEKAEIDYSKFSKIVKDSFQFKRKTLKNNLKQYDTEKIEEILKKNGYSLDHRAEEIPFSVFIEIASKF